MKPKHFWALIGVERSADKANEDYRRTKLTPAEKERLLGLCD